MVTTRLDCLRGRRGKPRLYRREVSLLGSIQLAATGVGTLFRQRHRQRRSQDEVQHSLREQSNLLALAGGLHAATDASASGRPDARALSATNDAAEDGPNHGAPPPLFRRIRGAILTLPLVGVGVDEEGLATYRDRVQLQDQQRLSRKFSRAFYILDVPLHVISGGYRVSVGGQGRVERRAERLPRLGVFGIKRIEQPNCDRRSGRHRSLLFSEREVAPARPLLPERERVAAPPLPVRLPGAAERWPRLLGNPTQSDDGEC